MKIASCSFIDFLKDLMRRRKRLPSQLANELGLSHATVSRWLSGKDQPSARSCQKLAEYSGMPLAHILSITGFIPPPAMTESPQWPEFREYAHQMYPDELDEDLITMIEDLIERRRHKRYTTNKNT